MEAVQIKKALSKRKAAQEKEKGGDGNNGVFF